jgi:serine protease Do
MKTKWIVSIITTLVIWGAGVYAFFYIKDLVPKKLKAESTILVMDDQKNKNKQKKITRELKEIIHEAQKLVVKIELPDGSLGSGFLYNDKGDVITNAHVVANTKEVKVKTADSKEFSGTVIGISSDTDVALVRVPGLAGVEPLKIAKNRKAEIGDEVLALGSPLGLQNTVTTGIISGIDRDFDLAPFHYEDVYQISAPIAPGNSGGPLIDSKTGEVLGINSAGMDQGSIGFSIPIPNVITLIEGWSKSPMASLPSVALEQEAYSYEKENSPEELAKYLVNYFYESINYGDYVTAYSLLGSSWQSKISYETFRNGYLNTLSVTIDDIVAKKIGEKVSVTVIITAEERKNGSTTYSKYKLSYDVGYENDQLKILAGKGEEIN